jgi:inorganic pyrophosphatase
MTTPAASFPWLPSAPLLLLASAVTAADTVLHPFLVAQPKQARRK